MPRVSGKDTKRPDHMIQFDDLLISIESKDAAFAIENDIGERLREYVKLLIKKPPISFRLYNEEHWEVIKQKFEPTFKIVSGAAFRMCKKEDLRHILKRGKLDIVFGIQFTTEQKPTVINILFTESTERLALVLKELESELVGLIEIRISKG